LDSCPGSDGFPLKAGGFNPVVDPDDAALQIFSKYTFLGHNAIPCPVNMAYLLWHSFPMRVISTNALSPSLKFFPIGWFFQSMPVVNIKPGRGGLEAPEIAEITEYGKGLEYWGSGG